jgi:hypothetical protein
MHIAKDGLTIPDFSEGESRNWIYFMFQISEDFFIFL